MEPTLCAGALLALFVWRMDRLLVSRRGSHRPTAFTDDVRIGRDPSWPDSTR